MRLRRNKTPVAQKDELIPKVMLFSRFPKTPTDLACFMDCDEAATTEFARETGLPTFKCLTDDGSIEHLVAYQTGGAPDESDIILKCDIPLQKFRIYNYILVYRIHTTDSDEMINFLRDSNISSDLYNINQNHPFYRFMILSNTESLRGENTLSLSGTKSVYTKI